MIVFKKYISVFHLFKIYTTSWEISRNLIGLQQWYFSFI